MTDVAPETLEPGDVLAGKYALERLLGQGGMALVYAAHHLDLDERVAIKVLRAEVASHPDSVKRFLREARAAAKIRSEHVARVSDVGRLESGIPYMVMEYLEGCDLEEIPNRRGTIAVEDALLWVLQACEAIAEAHAIGLVHRDLKPANLFLTTRRDGSDCVKVLDFGISKFTGAGAGTAGLTQGMLGSPLYMSPEQLRSAKDIDARTDVWSLGVILYELLAQTPPFNAQNLTMLVMAITQDTPKPVRTYRPDVPEALDAAVMRCLVKDRDGRTSDVAQLARDLVPFAPGARLSAERIGRILGKT
jgi:eukaryotic-like serine/threonine-protein kinase